MNLKTTKPWKRVFARTFDFFVIYNIVGLLFLIIIVSFFKGNFTKVDNNIWIYYFFFTVISAIPIETLLLWKTGTTLGKIIFGIKIKKSDGNLMSFKSSLKRTLGVHIKGEAFYCPIAPLARLYQFFKLVRNGECSWENENAQVYYIKNGWKRNTIGIIATLVASFSFSVFPEFINALA